MVDLNVASEIDNIVMGYAIDNNKPITKDNDESVSVESADTLSKEVEEHCDDYNDLLDFLIMTTDITNLVRVTLYKDMIGIGFDNGKYRNIVVNKDLYKTIDFNKVVADDKPTNHIIRLNIDNFILETICPGYDINGKINYLFGLIPSLTKIKVKDRDLPFFRETYVEKKEQVEFKEPMRKEILSNDEFNELDNLITEQARQLAEELYNGIKIKDITNTKKGFQCRQESAKSTRTDMQSKSPINYTKNSYVNENGVAVQYDEVTEEVDWTNNFKNTDSCEDTLYNLEMIVEKFTKGLCKKIGGFERFKEIVVVNDILIVNNIVYRPFANNTSMSTFLPVDIVGAFSQGCYAPFFDWSYLLRCNNLRRLSIDNVEYAEDYIVPANNMSSLYSEWFFKYLRHLKYLKIGDYEFDKEKEQYEPETVKVKKQKDIKTETGFFTRAKDYYQKSHFDYSRLAPTRLTDKLDNHFCGTFKDYIKNRGKKGLFRYVGGCAVRGILAATATLINAGTHMIGDTVGYVSQYGPHIERCEDRIGFTCYVGYKPNSRTQGGSLGFTSGSSVVDNRPYKKQTEIKSNKTSQKEQKPQKKKDDKNIDSEKVDYEFEDE